MGSNKDQGKVGTGNSPRGVSGKRKSGRSATKHKKAERSNKNKHPNNKRHYKSNSSSSSTENFSPSPKILKSQRKKRKYHLYHLQRSSSFFSSWPSSSLESSVTRNREGPLGRRFQVISEEDKFRYNLPTDRAKDANAHFETYVKEADLKQ